MEQLTKTKLAQVINVDEQKCINCHTCISACPVKYCNDGSGDKVVVNGNMCIACGKCLQACTHKARSIVDDFSLFIHDLKKGENIICIVAPSVVASFPNAYKNLNGWLKELGIQFIYDVSFGAELTVKSYTEHIKKKAPKTLIAQPCPSIVSYIQLYKPELLEHLAPADSPMVHSMKMIREHYPEYANYKIAALSPCVAKKREFEETGYGDYLITYQSIKTYLDENKINIHNFPATGFDTPKAERAVLFSSPGGLLKTLERWIPDIGDNTRRIEGPDKTYNYIDQLSKNIQKGIAPLLIDCLNCENGCNGGPGSLAASNNIDELEHEIQKRSIENRKHYQRINGAPNGLMDTINKYWNKDLYKRHYRNLWANVDLNYPNQEELQSIYRSMHKHCENDLFNCVACGYNSCEKMAIAIFNGLNKPENCHHYLQIENHNTNLQLSKSQQRVRNILETAHDAFIQVNNNQVIEQANQTFRKLVKRNDVIGRSLLEFLDEKNTEIILEHRRLREENKNSSYELTLKQSDGGEIIGLVSGSPLYDENKALIGSFAMISDITSLKMAEQSLRQSHLELEEKVTERTEELNSMVQELKFSTELIQSANTELEKLSIVASEIDNGVIIMDAEGNYEWVNEGYRKLFKKLPEQVIGKNILTGTTSNDVIREINTCIRQGIAVNYEFELTNGESNSKWIQANLTPILDLNGKIKKIIAIDTDITALKEKELEILTQKEEIQAQRDIAHRQSSEINASIAYASRIQNALLPNRKLFDIYFKENFILYAPKYSVSGDFYWISERNGKVFVAVVDCTGHGVPGAFMSMLGISYLNEIIDGHIPTEKLDAAIILGLLRNNIIQALSHQPQYEAKDGMDISMCIFDLENNTMQFSGAIQSIFLLRSGKIKEFKGDRMPVGAYEDNNKPFTNHVFHLEEDDQFYLFTDGIVDQFNSDNVRKLKKSRLREIILEFEKLPMQHQLHAITNTFEEWRGSSKQVDDMLLVGLKI